MNNLYEIDNGGDYIEISPRTNYGDGWEEYNVIRQSAAKPEIQEGSETIPTGSTLK